MDDASRLSLENHVRCVCREIENGLSFDENKQKYFETLTKLGEFVVEIEYSNLKYLNDISKSDFSKAKDIFRRHHYTRCCSRLLNSLSVDIFSLFTKEKIQTLDQIFRNGPPAEALLLLCTFIGKSSLGFKLHKCVSLVEMLLKEHKLAEIFWEQSAVSNDKQCIQSVDSQLGDQLSTVIVSLPEIVTNKLHEETSEIFYPRSYVPLACMDIFNTLEKARECLISNSSCSLEFVSKVFGRLALAGYSDRVWETLLPHLYSHVQTDYVWCRVCERVVTGMPSRCMESSITALLKRLPWFGLVEKFLGDSVVKNSSMQNLLCTKLLFHRHSSQVKVLQNIIGYLASSHTRHHLYIKVFTSLLEVWGDSSSVKHTSYEQHLYISQALLICVAHLSVSDKKMYKDELVRLLMPGVSCHIGHSDQRMRKLGMVVAETLAHTVDPTGPQLDFQFDHDGEVEQLTSLTMIPPEPSIEELDRLFHKVEISDVPAQGNITEQPKPKLQSQQPQSTTENTDSDLDSDDDLEPYDMSHDVAQTKVKSPKYVRDCMEGLISSEDPDRVEVCLREAETLIRKKPDGLQERKMLISPPRKTYKKIDLKPLQIAAEFSKILLHLNDSTAYADFIPRRFSAMVALAVQCPVQVSDYLTVEFYERNYNLRQRLDILEVLGAAAQELSRPSRDKSTPLSKVTEMESRPGPEPESWREIVEKRIESKTRRFAKGRTTPLPQPVVNRFTGVAGHFFYPLMTNFDRKENTFDLLGEDTLVLGRLVYTLGMVLYCAVNTPAAKQMAVTLLEFTWAVRFHTDVFVRQAVLFGTSMVILVVPGHSLVSDLHMEVTEMKTWLEELADKDPDTECRKLAVQALLLLENAIKQEFQSQASAT